jgi:hypothetical protein
MTVPIFYYIESMKKIIQEPLFHFLAIGMLLFIVYGLINTEESKDEIIIDTNLVSELSAKWQSKRDRQPNLLELRGMVDEYITQEVLYREALAMNLDHNDEIVKRRLAQKMEFISDQLAESLQPSEEMLKEFHNLHREQYKKPAIYTLQQVYFNTNKNENAYENALAALRTNDPSSQGDRISLPSTITETMADKIARNFGSSFIIALDSLPLNTWKGPIRSGLGIHLVNISKKTPGGYFSYDEISNKVNIDYNFEASKNFKKELVTTLLEKYAITFDLEDASLNEELNEKF